MNIKRSAFGYARTVPTVFRILVLVLWNFTLPAEISAKNSLSLEQWKRRRTTKWEVSSTNSITLKEEQRRRYLADSVGAMVCELAEREEILEFGHNKKARCLLLVSFSRVSDGAHSGVGFNYYRILRLKELKTGGITAENLLVWSDPFMDKGRRGVSKIYSVSDDGNVAIVEMRLSDGGADVYKKLKIRLKPPEILGPGTDD